MVRHDEPLDGSVTRDPLFVPASKPRGTFLAPSWHLERVRMAFPVANLVSPLLLVSLLQITLFLIACSFVWTR